MKPKKPKQTEDFSAYYTALEREVLELLAYHIKRYVHLEETGHHHPEHVELITRYEGLKTKLNREVKKRILSAVRQEKRDEFAMQQRLSRLCPECNTIRKIKILGEDQHEHTGFMCDRVKCLSCGHEFICNTPNTEPEQLIFMDMIIKAYRKLFKNEEFQKQMPEQFESFPELVSKRNRLKRLVRERNILNEKIRVIDEQLEQHLLDLRDELLLAKASSLYWNPKDKFLN